jgi:hypothetical protein
VRFYLLRQFVDSHHLHPHSPFPSFKFCVPHLHLRERKKQSKKAGYIISSRSTLQPYLFLVPFLFFSRAYTFHIADLLDRKLYPIASFSSLFSFSSFFTSISEPKLLQHGHGQGQVWMHDRVNLRCKLRYVVRSLKVQIRGR